jgi:hypothetical protein
MAELSFWEHLYRDVIRNDVSLKRSVRRYFKKRAVEKTVEKVDRRRSGGE